MSNDNDATTRDGRLQPDTDNKANNNQTADAQSKADGSQPNPPQPTISQAKLRANQTNAKKSTGPRTVRGKRHSSFNAMKHGLLVRKVMFSANGELNEDVQRVYEGLHEHFGGGDIVTELLVELMATDYWRLEEALNYELSREHSINAFFPRGPTPTLIRYLTMNRRSFDKTLQTLMRMQGTTEQEHAEHTNETEGDSSTEPQAEEDESDALTPQTDDESLAPASSGLTENAIEQDLPSAGFTSASEAAANENPAAGRMEGAA